MIVPRPYQSEAVEAVYEHLRTKDNNPCVVLPTGCHAKDHPILMYDGTVRKVQDISVGDIIMGADSTPRHVLALARGREPMARITPIKGEPFVVNMNHILSLVSTNEGKGDFTCYQKGGEITNITVREYLTKSKSWRHLRKLYRVPVNFSIPKNLPIPPHILGLLLGDGIMTNAIGLTSAEEELGDEFSRYAESIGCSVRVTENDRNVPTYYAVVAKGAKNPLFEILHQLGLRGHCAHNKFIPKEYLTASRSDRLQLLAGLLDSDGFFDGHCLEITTQSRELAGDIVFLARSLGFMANCHEKYCACQTGAGGWYYRVHISGDLSPIPCRRKRHVFHVRQQKKNVLRTGFSVEILSEDDFYGFELDGDHLYVDGNFVVHHNTGKSLVLAQIAKDSVEKWNGRVLILAHVKELLEQNADKIRKLCPELKIFDLVIVDECFPAGTLIDTPRGQIPIEDLYVGQPVRHALGVGNIEAISSRPAFEIMKLELSNGKSIECTPNHPFFTESGWCKASALAVGTCLFSREDVSRLRERFSSEYLVRSERETGQMPNGNGLEAQKILFPRVPVNGTPSAAGKQGSGKSVHELETESKNSRENVPVLRQGISSSLLPSATDVGIGMEFATVLFNILLQESRESNVSAGSCGKNVRDAESNRSPTIDSRREWEDVEFSTGTAGADSERGNGIPNLNNSATASCGSIALLQTGCGNSISPSGNTTGWREPFCKENTQNRQTDSGMAGGIRVVGITHIKLKSPRTVYNLQVAGHPSFYADGVLVHNCHLIAPEGDGMYRTFLADMKVINPHVRVIGLTATPFRLKGGLICKPENILNEICYEAGLKEMIQQGYLSPLISRAGRAEANLANLHIRGGEFISDEVAVAMDNDALVTSACREIVELTRDRKSVLIFTASVDHCKHVAEKIQAFSGKECAIVTGDTSPAERAEIIARFKGEFIPADFFGTPKPPLKFLANVNVLTCGFDAPNTDCVVMLRPTNSPGLLIQCAGRGTRLSPETGKSSCLFLDYGGNILRHGPLDMIKVKEPGSGKGGDAPAKKCPQCLALIHAGYTACPECGYVFPPKESNDKMTQTASSAGVISGQVDYTDYEVLDVYYCVHEKRGADPDAPKTMRVDYQVGFNEFKSEWVCPEHTGYARGKFEKWWHERAALGCPMPRSAREAVSLANEGLLAAPESITVKTIAGERFERVTGFRLKERPVMREPGEDLEPGETWVSTTSPDDPEEEIPF